MRIVDRKTFLRLPEGTLYAKWGGEPTIDRCFDIGDLRIKGGARGETDWWWVSVAPFPEHNDDSEFVSVAERLLAGEEFPPDFETVTSDGLFDQEQLFAVFSEGDVDALIARLQTAKADAFGARQEIEA